MADTEKKERFTKQQRKALGVVFVIVFLNLIGFGIIIPLLPFYAETFNGSPAEVGLLIGAYAAAQFIGSPVWGRFSDRRGRKITLIYSLFGAALGYVLFGLARSMLVLFISRIFSGFMNGNISAAQAYVADVTEPRKRARGLGIIGAAFGMGFILGPALGGLLSNWGYSVPAYAAAVLSLLNIVAVYLWLPEADKRSRPAEPAGRGAEFNFGALRQALKRPLIGPLLYSRFFFSMAFATFTTVFALYAQFALHLDAQYTGYILAYAGLLIVLVQGVVIGPLTRIFAEGNLLFQSVLLMALSLLAWAFVQNVAMLLLVLIPLSLASGVFNTVINSAISKAVAETEVGGMLGISTAVDSFTRIIAPSVGGFVLAEMGSWAPGLLSFMLLVLIVPYTRKKFITDPHPALNGGEEN